MRTLADHIENARMRPMHVRKQITFATAFAGAGLVAVLWLGINLATGSFALNADSFKAANVATSGASKSTNTSLLGAVGAAFSGKATPAQVDVVSAGTNTSVNAPAVAPAPERTVIPF